MDPRFRISEDRDGTFYYRNGSKQRHVKIPPDRFSRFVLETRKLDVEQEMLRTRRQYKDLPSPDAIIRLLAETWRPTPEEVKEYIKAPRWKTRSKL